MRRMFTEKQVKEMSAEALESVESGTIADSLGLDSNGKIVKGQASGGGGEVKFEIPFSVDSATFTNTSLYSKFVCIDKCLYFICSGRADIGAINITTDIDLVYELDLSKSMPLEYREKIYRADGTKLSEEPTGTATYNTFIASGFGRFQNEASNSSLYRGFYILSNTANKIRIRIQNSATASAKANGVIDFRLMLLML